MVKRGSTTFSATKVAKGGLTATAALQKILDLEKDVSKLRHHVSVLSKRNHGLQKEVDRLKKEEVAVVSEVASPERVEEPEPLVVAEPEETVEEVKVAAAFVASAGVAGVRLARVATPEVAGVRLARVATPEVAGVRLARVATPEVAGVRLARAATPEVAGVRLARVATPEVAEPDVAEEDDEDDCRSVVTVTGKRRRLDDEGEGEGVEEVGTSVVVPTGPRGGAPAGLRLMAERVGGIRRGSGVPADLFVRRAYRFVDRTLVGVRNGMVGDTYQTRGNFARAPFVDRGGFRGRGYRPYR